MVIFMPQGLLGFLKRRLNEYERRLSIGGGSELTRRAAGARRRAP